LKIDNYNIQVSITTPLAYPTYAMYGKIHIQAALKLPRKQRGQFRETNKKGKRKSPNVH